MKQYLTTPIYYASGSPHLGHAYTTIIADCYKRYRRLRGDQVILATGTDEHGQKIQRTAEKLGADTSSFIAERSSEFVELWDQLDLDVDRFERTSSDQHIELVLALWQKLRNNGDIYKGHYEGLYCVECEQYFVSDSVNNGDCPVHRKPLEHFAEESYFFRLGQYQQRLIDHIQDNEDFIVPAERRNEVLSFLKLNKLHDLSISRTSTDWGVKVPGDEAHVIYVWLDALATYLSALVPAHELDELNDNRFWQNSGHFIGKDILTFHAVYWPALLWSAGLSLPRQLIVNGWLTVEGRKIAKSDPSTIVDPVEISRLVGNDGIRFYFLRAVALGQDIDFQQSSLIQLVNAELANNIGNLFSRVIKLFERDFPEGISAQFGELAQKDLNLIKSVEACFPRFEQAFSSFQFASAAQLFVKVASIINADIQRREPWKITDRKILGEYLWTLHLCLSRLTVLGESFVPGLVRSARAGLNLSARCYWREIDEYPSKVSVSLIEPIYQRIRLTT